MKYLLSLLLTLTILLCGCNAPTPSASITSESVTQLSSLEKSSSEAANDLPMYQQLSADTLQSSVNLFLDSHIDHANIVVTTKMIEAGWGRYPCCSLTFAGEQASIGHILLVPTQYASQISTEKGKVAIGTSSDGNSTLLVSINQELFEFDPESTDAAYQMEVNDVIGLLNELREGYRRFDEPVSDFMKEMLYRNWTYGQMKTLCHMSFSPEEIVEMSDEKIANIFYCCETPSAVFDETRHGVIDGVALRPMNTKDESFWVRTGDTYLGLSVKRVEVLQYAEEGDRPDTLSIAVDFEGDILLDGRFSSSGEFTPTEVSSAKLPVLNCWIDAPETITIENWSECSDAIVSDVSYTVTLRGYTLHMDADSEIITQTATLVDV